MALNFALCGAKRATQNLLLIPWLIAKALCYLFNLLSNAQAKSHMLYKILLGAYLIAFFYLLFQYCFNVSFILPSRSSPDLSLILGTGLGA